jgi:hypothetical protein
MRGGGRPRTGGTVRGAGLSLAGCKLKPSNNTAEHGRSKESSVFSFTLKRRYDFQGEYFIVKNSARSIRPAMSIDELMNYRTVRRKVLASCGVLLAPMTNDAWMQIIHQALRQVPR